MSSRYILTGAPGAGKTSVIRHLANIGHDVVHEAATDVIAAAQARGTERPWEQPRFIADIAALQMEREATAMSSGRRYSDRSVYCTIALAEWLGHPVPPDLLSTAEELLAARWFAPRVFFIEPLGFIENTPARRIGLEEAARFGDLHRSVYARYGFELLSVPVAPVADRAAWLLAETGAGCTARRTTFSSSACENGFDSLGNPSSPPGGNSA
jgi:predicted ATPase